MVKEVEKDGKIVYQCEDCGFHYEDRDTAERCEAFCKEKGMCSTDITANSIERKQK